LPELLEELKLFQPTELSDAAIITNNSNFEM
jgi:hypothetical protein